MTCETCSRLQVEAAAMRGILQRLTKEYNSIPCDIDLVDTKKALQPTAGSDLLKELERLRGLALQAFDQCGWDKSIIENKEKL